jgi:ferrous iron transport protein B
VLLHSSQWQFLVFLNQLQFVMDKLLRKIGLSGRSFVPMLIGFGCSVPAIMATRTLSSERDRKMTILLTPFMSCSAKLPIYAVFASAFFPGREALVMIALYVIGMIVAILSGLLLKNTLFKGNPVPFVMELPAYRMPSFKSVTLHMFDKAKDFARRAFTIIFLASIIIWFLQSMDWGFNLVQDSSSSILAAIGNALSPVFAPLGFGDWRLSTALITGLSAKEAVISTLAVLTNAGGSDGLAPLLQQLMTPLSAFAFLCFTLLYMPCIAAMAATKREMGSAKSAVLAMAYQTVVAWIVAFLIYQVGTLIGF